LALNLLLALRVLQLFAVVQAGKAVDRSTALPLYKYSMLYLFLLFLAMSLDRVFFI
jgi:heme o synthase